MTTSCGTDVITRLVFCTTVLKVSKPRQKGAVIATASSAATPADQSSSRRSRGSEENQAYTSTGGTSSSVENFTSAESASSGNAQRQACRVTKYSAATANVIITRSLCP